MRARSRSVRPDAAADIHNPIGQTVITKRCSVCGRFRAYDEEDRYCIVCGHEALEEQCGCGRPFDYALAEGESTLHCPRCGRVLRGRQREYE